VTFVLAAVTANYGVYRSSCHITVVIAVPDEATNVNRINALFTITVAVAVSQFSSYIYIS
jgi:hypothetical protein